MEVNHSFTSGFTCLWNKLTSTGRGHQWKNSVISTWRKLKPTRTCQICLEPIESPNIKFKNNKKCSHNLCTNCIAKYIKSKLEDHPQGNIKCPDLNCHHFLDPISCRTLIDPSLFVKWCDVLCESAITGANMRYCPNKDCNTPILNECGGDLKKSQCPYCKQWFCFTCKGVWSLWHSWFWCKDGDDRAFNRLVAQKKWRSCPQCRRFVERISGCRFIRCRCGNNFCYDCGRDCGRVAHLAHDCRGARDSVNSVGRGDVISLLFVLFLTMALVLIIFR